MYRLLSRHSLCHYFWSFCLFSSSTGAQTIQQLLWKIPDGTQPDFSTTFTAGNTIPLAWNALVTTSYLDTTKTLVDLWATAYETNLNPIAQRLMQNVNLTSGGGRFSWTIAIPESSLDIDAKYVLRFKPASSTYNPDTGELSSPGLLILKAAAASSSTLSSSSSSSASTTTPSTSSTSSASSTNTATTSTLPTSQSAPISSQLPAPGGLGTAAKAGIGISAVAGAFGMIAAVYFFLVRRKRNRADVILSSAPQMEYKREPPPPHPQELQGSHQVAELG